MPKYVQVIASYQITIQCYQLFLSNQCRKYCCLVVQIVRVLGSIGTAARHSVVTIDRGTAHGVQTGHVFSV